MTELQFPGDDSIAGVQPLLFRVADRMRLEGYVSALVQDNMSLSLVSGFDAILDHYGKLLVARLREAGEHPKRYRIYDPPARRVLVADFPYAVLYVPRADYVLVVAIMHLKRRPGYWRSRLTD